jgi:hypothetical protein
MIIRESKIREIIRSLMTEADDVKQKTDPEFREDRVQKREMMHRIFLIAQSLGSKIPLLIALQAVSETHWGQQTVKPNNVLNIKDPKKIAAYKKIPAKARKGKGAMQYRSFSTIEDCIRYYIENIEPRVLGIQTDYERENSIPPENSPTNADSTTISSLIDNLGKIGYAIPAEAYKTHIREVTSGPTLIVNIDNPNSVAVKNYREKYKKEIDLAGSKFGYRLR